MADVATSGCLMAFRLNIDAYHENSKTPFLTYTEATSVDISSYKKHQQ